MLSDWEFFELNVKDNRVMCFTTDLRNINNKIRVTLRATRICF